MSNLQFDQLVDKLGIITINVNRHLRLIAQIDKKAIQIQSQIKQDEENLQRLIIKQQLEESQKNELKIKKQFHRIFKLYQTLHGYSIQKLEISKQLTKEGQLFSKQVLQELNKKNKGKLRQELENRKKRKMEEAYANKIKEESSIDQKMRLYCYCGQIAFGEMIGCENPFCERQWFHQQCVIRIQGERLPEKWYCKSCLSLKKRTKNPVSSTFLERNNLDS